MCENVGSDCVRFGNSVSRSNLSDDNESDFRIRYSALKCFFAHVLVTPLCVVIRTHDICQKTPSRANRPALPSHRDLPVICGKVVFVVFFSSYPGSAEFSSDYRTERIVRHRSGGNIRKKKYAFKCQGRIAVVSTLNTAIVIVCVCVRSRVFPSAAYVHIFFF